MPRTHGYALKGKRCYGSCDWGAKGRTNVIGALLGQALLTVALLKGNVNTEVFIAWVEQDLIPKLPTESSRVKAPALIPLTPPYVRYRIRRFWIYE